MEQNLPHIIQRAVREKATSLDLSSNQLSYLPPEIGQLTNLHHLDLSSNQLSYLPLEIGQLTNLHHLDLSSNQLSYLPPEIGQLTSLKSLSLSSNQLSYLPPEIGQLTSLKSLKLTNNKLDTLPQEIGQLDLQRMTCGYNPFPSLPREIRRKGWKAISNFYRQQPVGGATTVSTEVSQGDCLDIDTLVQEVKQKVHDDIQARCGTMRVLDMTQPIELLDSQTRVNFREKSIKRSRLEIEELFQDCDLQNFDHFGLGRVRLRRMRGLKALSQYSKLMIFGKPGSGKTTFLKWLAMRCNRKFERRRVPIFVTLKNFAEDKGEGSGLLAYIAQQWATCGIRDAEIVELLLNQGRALVLLDGLDEVRETDHDRVLQEVRDFAIRFHTCLFCITCRIAAREYTFKQFTEAVIADFIIYQVINFAHRWFKAKQDPNKAEEFIQKLRDNKPMLDLAISPLMMTLLCLVFEEAGAFPCTRSELYKEGLDILLKKWDAKRNVKREEVHQNLSLQRKEDLLSQLAFNSFERSEYFFKQNTVKQQIRNYIQNLPDASTEPEDLQLESEAMFKSIEAQQCLLVERARSIYSFSHLMIQEYFTARKVIASRNPKVLDQALQELVTHLTEKRWREVFLLAMEMVADADYLLGLMKEKVDNLLAGNDQLQQFLTWVKEKSESAEFTYKPAAVRASYFYHFSIALPDVALARAIDLAAVHGHDLELSLDRRLARICDRALHLYNDITHSYRHYLAFERIRVLSLSLSHTLDLDLARYPDLKQSLQSFKDQLPDPKGDGGSFMQWCHSNGKAWTEELRAVIIKRRNIGRNWQFSEEQEDKLRQYYDANKLLVDCLNSDCYVTRSVREGIEDTMLLPIAEIEKRRKQNAYV